VCIVPTTTQFLGEFSLTKSEIPGANFFAVHVSWRFLAYTRQLTDRDHLDWLNLIQHLSVAKHGQIFLTLNPPFEPDPDLVFKEFLYDHPVLDANVCNSPLPPLGHRNLQGR